MFCKYKKLFQQVLKKGQSHKIPTPPFKSYLISFMLLCKSQSHLSTTKTCFPSCTLSLVLASLLQLVALALKPARTDHSQTGWSQSNALRGKIPRHPILSDHCGVRWRFEISLKSLPVNTDLSGPLSFKAPKLPMQAPFRRVDWNSKFL